MKKIPRFRYGDYHQIESSTASNPTPFSRNVPNNPPPPPWLLPGFFNGVENDEVDTTLRLRPPGTTTPPPPEKLREPQTSAIPPLPRWLLPGFFAGVEDDEVDTTLSLSPPGTTSHIRKSRKPPEKATGDARNHSRFDFSDRQLPAIEENPHQIQIGAAKLGHTTPPPPPEKAAGDARNRSRFDFSGHQLPAIEENHHQIQIGAANNNNPPRRGPIRQSSQNRSKSSNLWAFAPAAVKSAVESRGGSSGQKVGWQNLKASDFDTCLQVERDHEELLWEFLRGEEVAAALCRAGDGLMASGVDAGKRVYPNLRIAARSVAGAVVIENDWSKVIGENKPKVGDVVEIWGFRVRGEWKPCLAFNFRDEREIHK